MNKIDLSYIQYRGGIWGRNSPASRSWGWLCEKTNHGPWHEDSRERFMLIDGQFVEPNVTDTVKSANMSKADYYGMIQILDGAGWYMMTYHTTKTNWVGNTYISEQLVHIFIEDDLLAIEFKLSQPWN
jgi:hypothetical protein